MTPVRLLIECSWRDKMKQFFSAFFLLLFAVAVDAQTKSDEEAARRLPQAFCDAWAKHDGHELAKIMADDVDFVTVATTYLHGRADFEKFHVRLLGGRFKQSSSRQPCGFCGPIWPLLIGAGKSKLTGIPMGPCASSRATA